MKMIEAKAPGKLILSGEHAVVHGYPALAMGINRYAKTVVSSQSTPSIFFDLLNLKYQRAHTLAALRRLKARIQTAHKEFKRGERSIRDVLKRPFELMQYTATNLADKLNLNFTQGVKIHTHSDIPLGCGMGSSAATIVSTNHALSHYHERDLALQKYVELGIDAENMQHGYSSGIDLQISIQGGCLFFDKGEVYHRASPAFSFGIIHTGKSESSTGECVKHAEKFFKESEIGKEFEATTHLIDQALQNKDWEVFKKGIQQNHRLLTRIGVVPEKIQSLIQDIEQSDAVAKICGAGSIRGDAAGVVWVIYQNREAVSRIIESHGYQLEHIECEEKGVTIV